MKAIRVFLAIFFISQMAHAGATFNRLKTWTDEILTSSDLNAEFDNIINNLTPAGVDDYSASTTEMQTTVDPYPGASASLATSLAGELARLRYQLDAIVTMFNSNATYWYEDPTLESVGQPMTISINGTPLTLNNGTGSGPMFQILDNGTTQFAVLNGGNVTIGTSTSRGKLNVVTGDPGAIPSINAAADDIVVIGPTDVGMSFIANATNDVTLHFGDELATGRGSIQYINNAGVGVPERMVIGSGGQNALSITSVTVNIGLGGGASSGYHYTAFISSGSGSPGTGTVAAGAYITPSKEEWKNIKKTYSPADENQAIQDLKGMAIKEWAWKQEDGSDSGKGVGPTFDTAPDFVKDEFGGIDLVRRTVQLELALKALLRRQEGMDDDIVACQDRLTAIENRLDAAGIP